MTSAKYWIFVGVAIVAEYLNLGSVQAQLPSEIDDLMKQMLQMLDTSNGSGLPNLSQLPSISQLANLSQLVDLSQLTQVESPQENVDDMDLNFEMMMEYLRKPTEEQEILTEHLRQTVENLPAILNETIQKHQFHPNQQSLVLVLDTAMPSDMYKDIEKIIKGIVEWSAAKKLSPIFNYIFVGFDYQGESTCPNVNLHTSKNHLFLRIPTAGRHERPKTVCKSGHRAT
jgi:hypothetical protein